VYQYFDFYMVDLAGIEPVSKLDPIQPSTCLSNYYNLMINVSISKSINHEVVVIVSWISQLLFLLILLLLAPVTSEVEESRPRGPCQLLTMQRMQKNR